MGLIVGIILGGAWMYFACTAVENGSISVDTFLMGCAVLIAGFMAGRDNE